MSSTQAQLDFKPGKIVAARWKVLQKLGSGACGSVFRVEDLHRKGYIAALKTEKIGEDEDGVLKLEAGVLRKLVDKKCVIRLIHSGKRAKYSFIVMTMCGHDLMYLKRKSPNSVFSPTTGLRVAIHALYAIKQVHEVGFIHRDVKPGNMMTGAVGTDKRTIFLIDYGMCRSYVVRSKTGQISLRPPRRKVLLRGTLRYCSINVHRRLEQGRVDDLWAMVYTVAELCGGVPWNKLAGNEKEIAAMKEAATDEEVFKKMPDLIPIAAYLRQLCYGDRPDYFKIYSILMAAMKRDKVTFGEAYDWEDDDLIPDINTALDYSEREKKTLAPLGTELEVEGLVYPNTHHRQFQPARNFPL